MLAKTYTTTNQEKLEYLKSVDIFQDLTEAEIHELDQLTKMCMYSSGHLFYMPEDPGEILFILKKGRVQLYRVSPDGRKLVLATLMPGTIFGHMAMIGQRMHNTFAEAVDECRICIMSRADLEELVMYKPQVALRLLDAVGQRLVEVEQRFEDIAFRRMPARLSRLLLQLSEEHDSHILKGYTHQMLADTLGTYRETTTQTLNDFKGQGVIALGRKTIEILDPGALEGIAADS